MDNAEWMAIVPAPENQIVMTKIDDGNGCRNEAPLIRHGNLWYFPDESMYVYYRPTHWRPCTPEEKSLAVKSVEESRARIPKPETLNFK